VEDMMSNTEETSNENDDQLDAQVNERILLI